MKKKNFKNHKEYMGILHKIKPYYYAKNTDNAFFVSVCSAQCKKSAKIREFLSNLLAVLFHILKV